MTPIVQGVDEAIERLRQLGADVYKVRQPILTRAAKPLREAGKAAAPKSGKPHSRYNTSKLTNKLKAPAGKGRIVATYHPGNMGRSISTMRFARAKSKVFVGPRRARNASGTFAGSRVDGYYMGWVEKGTRKMSAKRFWEPTADAMGPTVQNQIIAEFKKEIEKYERKA